MGNSGMGFRESWRRLSKRRKVCYLTGLGLIILSLPLSLLLSDHSIGDYVFSCMAGAGFIVYSGFVWPEPKGGHGILHSFYAKAFAAFLIVFGCAMIVGKFSA